MYFKRTLESTLLKASEDYPVVMVIGSRQVGKTTLLKKIAGSGKRYVSLYSPANRALAKTDPDSFLHTFKPPLIIDELQYAPELLQCIKKYVDIHGKSGDFWLSGSQLLPLAKDACDSFDGQATIIYLHGLSNCEIESVEPEPFVPEPSALHKRFAVYPHKDPGAVFDRIFKGSIPAVHSMELDRESFYSSYISTYLHRDIRDQVMVRNELAFLRFMTTCAARTGKMIRYADLAREVGISIPTARHWMTVLVSSGVVFLLEPFTNVRQNRVVKMPQIYFLDTGLCTYLTGWGSAAELEASDMSEALFKTYAVSEIIKNHNSKNKKQSLYYYNDTYGNEIDLIIEQDDILHPVAIRKNAEDGKEAAERFDVLKKARKRIGTGGVVCLSCDIKKVDEMNWYVPVWLL